MTHEAGSQARNHRSPVIVQVNDGIAFEAAPGIRTGGDGQLLARVRTEWKSKMLKQSDGDHHDTTNPKPTTDEERRARLKELVKLTTREKLLRIINLIGDESVGDDQLLKALIVLEDIEPNKSLES